MVLATLALGREGLCPAPPARPGRGSGGQCSPGLRVQGRRSCPLGAAPLRRGPAQEGVAGGWRAAQGSHVRGPKRVWTGLCHHPPRTHRRPVTHSPAGHRATPTPPLPAPRRVSHPAETPLPWTLAVLCLGQSPRCGGPGTDTRTPPPHCLGTEDAMPAPPGRRQVSSLSADCDRLTLSGRPALPTWAQRPMPAAHCREVA